MKPISKTKNIALSLLLVVSMLIAVAPAMANAQTQVITRDITLLIAANPNPVGVGQQIQILCWADIFPNVYVPQNTTNPSGGAPLVGGITYARYHDFTFTITHPDGTSENKVFSITDPLGSAYFTYTPSEVGTYTVVCHYPGESFVNGVHDPGLPEFTANVIFNPETSKTISFVVQSTQLQQWPENPLPTGYWTRPIDASNRFWGSIAGNWLGIGQFIYGYSYYTNFAPYTTAPNTAHVVWNKVWQDGGLVGGENGVNEYYTGESYQGKFQPIIMDGRLYSSLRVGSAVSQGFVCYDLQTGKELFRRNDTTISFGFDFSLQWEDAHGTIDYLVGSPVSGTTGQGTTMNFYDPLNGERCFTIENCTYGWGAFTPAGNIIINNTGGAGITNDINEYILMNNQLIVWSFYKCVHPASGFSWAPSQTMNYNWADGIEYTVSVPKPANAGPYSIGPGPGGIVDGTIIVARSVDSSVWPPMLYLIGIRCTDGQVLWTSQTSLLNDPGIWRGGGGVQLDSADGVYLNYKKETMQVIGWDLANGNVKFTTDPRNTNDWASYTGGWCMDAAYGKFYVGTYDGYIIAYDAKTGKEAWRYSSGNAGLETPYGTWPFFLGIPYGMTIADGKVFAPTGEHSPNDPLYRGEQLHVIDVNTGQKVWSIQGWWLANAIADGYYTAYNGYDGEIYTFGKGPSSTTVAASPGVVTAGSTVTLSGTVTDQSSGQTCLGVPTAGTAAVSDDSMTAWMEYLYMQDQMPNNAKGVPVDLVAIDSNGGSTTVGTATSDITGFYGISWNVPTTPGVYKIVANFAGTNSYYSSSAVAAITVVSASSTSSTQKNFDPMDVYIPVILAVIILLIALALVAIVILRKK